MRRLGEGVNGCRYPVVRTKSGYLIATLIFSSSKLARSVPRESDVKSRDPDAEPSLGVLPLIPS